MIEVIILLFVYLVGCFTGLYAASQMEDHIDTNIKENYESIVKKHYKKKK